MSKSKINVGITMGDPSGIGPAITLKALRALKGSQNFIVLGDKSVLSRIKGYRESLAGARVIDLRNVNQKRFQFGKVSAEYGRASIAYIDKALELIKRNQIDCLVTCPISKEAVNLAGIQVSGHTEYLQKNTNSRNVVMMLLNKKIRFALATRHIPLAKVSSSLNAKELSKTIEITHRYLKEYFSISIPKIVVCGLNPHASDNGLLGKEELRVILPVVESLKKRFSGITGPLPADIAILGAYEKRYDCAIAIYHDQALIALKLLGYVTGVNLTLGLPFVRSSPLHGTAFDIARTPKKADHRSLCAAIHLAVECTLNQKKD